MASSPILWSQTLRRIENPFHAAEKQHKLDVLAKPPETQLSHWKYLDDKITL